MADEIQNLILNVQGRDQLEQLRQALAREEETLRQTIALYGQHDQMTRMMAQSVQGLNRQIVEAEKQVAATNSATKNYGQGLMQVAFAAQDVTSANGDMLRAI